MTDEELHDLIDVFTYQGSTGAETAQHSTWQCAYEAQRNRFVIYASAPGNLRRPAVRINLYARAVEEMIERREAAIEAEKAVAAEAERERVETLIRTASAAVRRLEAVEAATGAWSDLTTDKRLLEDAINALGWRVLRPHEIEAERLAAIEGPTIEAEAEVEEV